MMMWMFVVVIAVGKYIFTVNKYVKREISLPSTLSPAPQHYGGRPGRTSEDAMMILSEKIHEAWKHGEIFTAVFMDVAGAFNLVKLLPMDPPPDSYPISKT